MLERIKQWYLQRKTRCHVVLKIEDESKGVTFEYYLGYIHPSDTKRKVAEIDEAIDDLENLGFKRKSRR
ncbi:MAG: hypothetical protein GF411_12965 [Candidatus Lokiarchaeota archaeon]|nr:hypothetical protein [Candidatus Lokiarchaeota archaeon]